MPQRRPQRSAAGSRSTREMLQWEGSLSNAATRLPPVPESLLLALIVARRGPGRGCLDLGCSRHGGALKHDRYSPRMSSEYIFTMYRVDKFYGPERQVLSNISLSFLPGAKIGVLGPNGAGKSTVLRIMAGQGQAAPRPARPPPGAPAGPLPQEPEAHPEKKRGGNGEGRRPGA